MKTRLEREPLKAQEQSTRELHKLQAIIQTKEHELKAEQKLIQGDADKQIEALKQAKHIDEAVEELEMDQLQKAKVVGTQIEVNNLMKRKRSDMEDETKFLLDSQRRQLEDAAAERVEQRANQAMQYHTEAIIAGERRKSYLDHNSYEKLRDNHVVKVEQLNEAANAEKSRVSQQKADLENSLLRAVAKINSERKILSSLNHQSKRFIFHTSSILFQHYSWGYS